MTTTPTRPGWRIRCGCGPEAIARCKALIARVGRSAVDDAMIAGTARRIARIRATPEGREGIAAFLEKRKPDWTPE